MPTFVKIAETNSGALSGLSTYTFSNLPQTYDDIMIYYQFQASANGNYDVSLNPLSASFPSGTTNRGVGLRSFNGGVSSYGLIASGWICHTATALGGIYYANGYLYMPDYKSGLIKNATGAFTIPGGAASSQFTYITQFYTANSGAITGLQFSVSATTWYTLSNIQIYGIKNS